MKFWEKKVAIVTDCNDEVGLYVIEKLGKVGVIVVGFAKTEDILTKTTEKLKSYSQQKISGKMTLCRCDITNIEELKIAFKKVIAMYGGVDILINNAYCNKDCLVSNGDMEDFREVIDVNIKALIACSRLAAGSMIERKARGHIININDLCAYQIPLESLKTVFIASKATVTSVNEILRHEFRFLKANIKVTNIACGSIESVTDLTANDAKLKIGDVAKLVKLILNTPEHLQVHEVLIDSTRV